MTEANEHSENKRNAMIDKSERNEGKTNQSNKAQSFLDWAKVLAVAFSFVTAFSGLFGLGFQKGVLLEMRFKNMSGAYDVDEVLNSAVIGYFHLFSKLMNGRPFDWYQYGLILVGFSAFVAVMVFLSRLYDSESGAVHGVVQAQKTMSKIYLQIPGGQGVLPHWPLLMCRLYWEL